MARPQKKGIDYFSFDVDFFYDKKIKALKGRYGSDGVILYIYLLTQIYKDNGYFLRYDEDTQDVISDDLNMDYNKIRQIVNFLLKRSLFDDTLFKSDKVLSSRGIQLRFQEAVKTRGTKTAIEVESKLWLLSESETYSYIKCSHFYNSSEKNSSFSENNPQNHIEELHKVKESKVKKSKVKERKAETSDGNNKELLLELFGLYEQNIGTISGLVEDKILYWCGLVELDLIEYAIEEADVHNARSWNYIEKILNSKYHEGCKCKADAISKSNKYKQPQSNVKKSKFNNYTDTNCVDYSGVEKKILEDLMNCACDDDEETKDMSPEEMNEYFREKLKKQSKEVE